MRRAAAIMALVLSLATAAPALATLVVNPDGSQWNYGAQLELLYGKKVWSNYYHPSLTHHSTAACGTDNVTAGATAGRWSNATAHCNAWDQGYVTYTNN